MGSNANFKITVLWEQELRAAVAATIEASKAVREFEKLKPGEPGHDEALRKMLSTAFSALKACATALGGVDKAAPGCVVVCNMDRLQYEPRDITIQKEARND